MRNLVPEGQAGRQENEAEHDAAPKWQYFMQHTAFGETKNVHGALDTLLPTHKPQSRCNWKTCTW